MRLCFPSSYFRLSNTPQKEVQNERKMFEFHLLICFFFLSCFVTETALLLPAELSKSRHENDTVDIRRNLRLRYRDTFKHNREHE